MAAPRRRTSAPRAPTVAELTAAMDALTPKESALQRHASTIVVAIVLALILWVGSSVSSLTTTVTRISANVDQVQSAIGDLRTGQSQAAKTMGDLQAGMAANKAQSDALEADLARTKDRVRALEGVPPLRHD